MPGEEHRNAASLPAAARAERARRAGRLDEAISIARSEAGDPRARLALAVALLERGDAGTARSELLEMLEAWAAEAGIPLCEPESVPELDTSARPIPAATAQADEIEAIDEGEWDAALDSAVPVVDQMHDVNRVAERVLMEEPEGLSEVGWEGREIEFSERAADAAAIDAAEVPVEAVPEVGDASTSRPRVLATLESWLGNVRREQERLRRGVADNDGRGR